MTSRPDDEHPRLADALRRALARGAAEVHPLGDGLTKIRARTAVSRRQRWLVPVAAATATIVVGGGVAWATGALGDRDEPPPFANSSTQPVTSSPATTTGTTIVTETPAPTATVPVYYLGAQPEESDPNAYRVFREYHRLPAGDVTDRDERVSIALAEMFANAPLDDDYFGRWPESAEVLGASVDMESQIVTVDLTGLEWTDVRLPDGRLVQDVGEALVQQLVFTATAAASMITTGDDFSATGVQVLVDGAPIDSLLGVDTSSPIARDAGNYQARIWITDPEWGESVGQPITVRLWANLFEGGPATWELRRDGAVVASDQTPMGESGRWHGYEFTIDESLSPGTYELTVLDAGGLGILEFAARDTKTFTVQ